MVRKPGMKAERDTVQVALRLEPSEHDTLKRLVKRAEDLAHCPPGTITVAAYARAAVLDYMGRELERMAEEPKIDAPRGPSVWERVRRAREYFPDPIAEPAEDAAPKRAKTGRKSSEP